MAGQELPYARLAHNAPGLMVKNCRSTRSMRARVRQTFLKEFVKQVRFPSGNLRKDSAWRDRLFWLIVDPLRLVAGLDSFWSSSLREVAIVLFNARLLPNHSFARRRSRYAREALFGGGRR